MSEVTEEVASPARRKLSSVALVAGLLSEVAIVHWRGCIASQTELKLSNVALVAGL